MQRQMSWVRAGMMLMVVLMGAWGCGPHAAVEQPAPVLHDQATIDEAKAVIEAGWTAWPRPEHHGRWSGDTFLVAVAFGTLDPVPFDRAEDVRIVKEDDEEFYRVVVRFRSQEEPMQFRADDREGAEALVDAVLVMRTVP